MNQQISSVLKTVPGKIGFYYRNLATGETFCLNPDEPLLAASVIKLFILAEAERRVEEGTLDRDMTVSVRRKDCMPSCGALTYLHEGVSVTVEDLYTMMIILSDNTATNLLIDLLGMDSINDCIRRMGFSATVLRRKLFDSEAAARGLENTVSAGEVGEYFTRLYEGRLISPKADADMLRILKDQRLNGKIPFFLHALKDAPEIAHKTGEDTGISHDAGIIYAGEPFAAVFLGNKTDVPRWERVIADLSLELYNSITQKAETV